MKNFSHFVCTIFRIVAVALATLFPAAVSAQVELTGVAAANGTVTLSFSALPPTTAAELSTDKTRITVRIPNATASEQARGGARPTDKVEHIAVQQDGRAVVVYIDLRDKQGFSQLVLPYSRALRLHVIDWTRLSARDNLYHSGLLSADSRATATARNYFARAAEAGSGDAAAAAGLALLADGKPDEAQPYLQRAVDLSTSVHDVYAALSDIAGYRNDSERAQRYAERFRTATQLDTFPSLLATLPKSEAAYAEPQTFAQSLLLDETAPRPDSTSTDTARVDTALNSRVDDKVRSLLGEQTPGENGYKPGESLVPAWMKWTVFGFLAVVCAGVIGMVYLYMRWRKKQLMNRSSAPAAQERQTQFEQEIADALQTATARRAADLYGRSGATEPADAPPPSGEQPDAEQHEPVEPQRHWMDDDDAPLPDDEETAPTPRPAPPQAHAADDVDALARKLRKGRGELELAVKLLARKKQDGKEKATALRAEDIPDSRSHVSRLARSLGVGAGELELRRNLGDTTNDGRIDKIRSLFGTGGRGK